MIEIEKGIPIPRSRVSSKYPVLDMVVGESFFVEIDYGEDEKSAMQSMRAAMYYYKKQHSINTCMEPRTRNGQSGIRVWRIE